MARSKVLSEEIISSDESDSDGFSNQYEPPATHVPVSNLKAVKELTPEYLKKHPKIQLWLIKAPKELSVSKINKVGISSIGEVEEFDVGGKSYKIEEDLTSLTTDNTIGDQKYSLLLPSNTSKYSPQGPIKFSRFFNISEDVTIPSVDWDKVKTAKPKVKQATNLRMRHFPSGYYIKDYKEASEPVIPQRKRKAETEEPDEVVEVPVKAATTTTTSHHHHHKHHKHHHEH